MMTKEVLIAFFLVGLSECAMWEHECPPMENRPDCHCRTTDEDRIDLFCISRHAINDYIDEVFQRILKGKRNIELEFSSSAKESRLPSTLLHGLHIQKLKISNSKVKSWADVEGGPAFVGLEDTLEKFEIDKSIDRRVKRNYMVCEGGPAPMTLAHLRRLREVSYDDNFICTLDNDWFENGPDSLEVLELKYCRIKVIGDRAFTDLPNLKHIDISSNKVERLARSMFPNPANHLKVLEFGDNELRSLPDDMFTNMPSLTWVNFIGCPLKHLPESTWGAVWSKLDILRLYSRELDCNEEQLAWIFKVKSPKYISGICKDRGQFISLSKLIKEKQREG